MTPPTHLRDQGTTFEPAARRSLPGRWGRVPTLRMVRCNTPTNRNIKICVNLRIKMLHPSRGRVGNPPPTIMCVTVTALPSGGHILLSGNGDQQHLAWDRICFQAVCFADGCHGGIAAFRNVPKAAVARSLQDQRWPLGIRLPGLAQLG